MASKKNAPEEYLAGKEEKTASQKRNEKEIALWEAWKENDRHPDYLKPLLKLYQPTFEYKKKSDKAPRTPESAFMAEQHKLFVNALNSYDPTKGAALRTHVENSLQKVRRFNNRMQNFAYIPENRAGKIGDLDRAFEFLEEEFGRAPNADELAEHMNKRYIEAGKVKRVTPKEVEQIQRERSIKDLRDENKKNPDDVRADAAPRQSMFEHQQIAVAKDVLHEIFPNKPMLQKLFNYTYGTNDHPQVTSTNELANHLGIKATRVSRLKKQMNETLADEFGVPRIKTGEAEDVDDEDDDE